MNLVAALKPYFRPPDPRSESEIDDDLDAEFAFHIEEIERELAHDAAPGMTPQEISRLARERFGDTERIKRRCRRIALEDRIMLQRINAVLMVVVMLLVIGVSVQMYITQKHNSLALLEITSEIASMRAEAGARARGFAVDGEADAAGVRVVPLRFADAEEVRSALLASFGPSAPNPERRNATITVDARTNSLIISAEPRVWEAIVEKLKDLDLDAAGERTRTLREDAAPQARILVQGDIERPGWFTITLDEVTYVADLLRQVGARPEQWAFLRRGAGEGTYYRAREHFRDGGLRMVVRPTDELFVSDRPSGHRVGIARHDWIETDVDGRPVEHGWRLEARAVTARLTTAILTRNDESMVVQFRYGSFTISRSTEDAAPGEGGGNYELLEDRLMLTSLQLPPLPESITFAPATDN